MALRKLLVIDDDPRFRALITDAFSDSFEVSCAQDGAEGLEACRKAGPDLVLVDLRMPRFDGLAVARALSGRETTRRIPVLVATASCVDLGLRKALTGLPNVRGIVDKLTGIGALGRALATAAVIV